ncbi:post-GPI attachment to proteins factor 2-like [Dermacentor albipictus]|uniref:post-GPI attachment to proteins factor 2-like n=1 Tax=Dermacentor albipictus TaxID=60249 RepID=UPI0038FC1979
MTPTMARPAELLRIPFRILAVVTVLLPFTSFVFCVLWSLLYNFSSVTSTHCGVANYLPSVSAAIGGHTPQRYIWRFGIALHSAPRILISAMYHRYYQNMLDTQHQYVARIAFWINVAEILTLLGLSNVTSTENYAVHEKMFVTFILCSLMYMILCCVIPSLGRRRSLSGLEAYSLKVKKQLTAMSVILSLLCTFFFVRHTTRCEPGMYTLFSASEYIVVICNMGFHMTSFWDFADKALYVSNLQCESTEDKERLLPLNQDV